MIRMIRILAWVAPADVHLARGQVNDQRGDGHLTIQWVAVFDGMITDRIGQVYVIFLNGLQGLDRM